MANGSDGGGGGGGRGIWPERDEGDEGRQIRGDERVYSVCVPMDELPANARTPIPTGGEDYGKLPHARRISSTVVAKTIGHTYRVVPPTHWCYAKRHGTVIILHTRIHTRIHTRVASVVAELQSRRCDGGKRNDETFCHDQNLKRFVCKRGPIA